MSINKNMAVGKNKRLSKGSKKGGKKKVVDPFTKKDWYDIKAMATFKNRQVGKTLVTRTIGNKIAADGLKGRVYEVNQSDLCADDSTFRKFKLICEDVQGKNCLTNFHGMSLTRDKMCSMVRKWQTMISTNADVKTTDGYQLRIFVVAFTKKQQGQVKKTTYAQSTQTKMIRRKMNEIVTREVQGSDVRELISKLIPDSIAKDIEKLCSPIYPLHDCYVSKIKVIRKPKIDLHKLSELHGDSGAKNAKGEAVARPDNYEPPVVEDI